MVCVWEPDPACLGSAWDKYSEEEQRRALSLATSALQGLTNNRVGTCPVTIRPCPEHPRCGCGWNPHIDSGGSWRNNCAHRSPCSALSEIEIPGPVGYIESFLIDGQAQDLSSGDWRMDNNNILVWQGAGPSPVPATQDLNKPDTEPGTWSITYSRSYPLSQDGRVAVARLALEFAAACSPSGKCSLPSNVRTVTRLGVSFTIESGLFIGGLTGIKPVDAFILQWAPNGPATTAVVKSPRDVPVRRTSLVPLGTPLGSV